MAGWLAGAGRPAGRNPPPPSPPLPPPAWLAQLLLAGLQVTSCLLFPNDIGCNYMSQQVHTSLQFIQEAHYRLMVDWTHNCCNVMIHAVHMLCDLIRFYGDGWVAMGL